MLYFNEFTVNNFEYFKNNKYNLNNNNILLKLLKEERNDMYEFFKKTNIDFQINRPSKINIKKIIKYCNTVFVDTKIIHLLENIDSTYMYLYITWNNNFIKIIINNKYQHLIDNFLSRLEILIKCIEYLNYKSNKKKSINIYLILSELTKKLPSNNDILDAKHINSGFSDLYNNYILIWRLEEFEKVIFHELIHTFDMDYRDKHVNNKINIIGEHRYYEAVTDFWGIFYYIIYLSMVTKIKIKLILELELCFIKNQAMVVNNYFNLGSWKKKPNITIKQNSAGFSYYIIKYLIFNYIIEYNLNINYILDNYDNLLDIILNNGLKQEKFNYFDSLRMTLLQLA